MSALPEGQAARPAIRARTACAMKVNAHERAGLHPGRCAGHAGAWRRPHHQPGVDRGVRSRGGLYRLSKHAVVTLTAALAHDLGAEDFTVNSIAPGMIQTEEGFRSAGEVGSEKRTARAQGVPNKQPDREPVRPGRCAAPAGLGRRRLHQRPDDHRRRRPQRPSLRRDTVEGRTMREERVTFFSDGEKVAGILRLPDDAGGCARTPRSCRAPAGCSSRRPSATRRTTGRSPTPGFAVLVIDFRGFGESEGDRTGPAPARGGSRTSRTRSRTSTTRTTSTRELIGTFGSGSTGGGNAVMLAGDRPAGARRGRRRCRSPTAPTGCAGCVASTSGSSSSPASTPTATRPGADRRRARWSIHARN